MKPYKKYKDSGVPWIGAIPQKWEVKKLGYIATAHNGDRGGNYPSGEDLVDEGVPFLSTSELKNGSISLEFTSFITEARYNLLSGIKLRVHDIIYCLRGSVGKCGLVTFDGGTLSSSLMGIRPKKINSRYLLYLLTSSTGEKQRHYLTTGSVSANLSAENVMRFIFPFPPQETQEKIAQYLDNKTSLIDNIISDKEKLLTLLAEERQAIISEAVTKGLDTNTPMKDSGVEWIGKIPVGWEVTKLSRLVSFHNGDRGVNYPSGDDIVDVGIPFLTATTLQNQKVNLEESSFITEERYNLLGGFKIEENDIIYCLRGSTIGKNAIANFSKGTVASSLMGIRAKKMSHNFLRYTLNSPIEELQRKYVINGSAAPNLSAENVGQFLVLSPPLEIQEQIVQFLDEKTSKIDQITADTKEQIALLKEYRQSLISEVVTGKVEV